MSQLIIANMAAPFFLSHTGNIWLFVSIIPVEMISCCAFKLHSQNLIKFLWGGRLARTKNVS